MNSAIGEFVDGEYHLRGTAISALIQEADFLSVLWLAWTGTRPTDAQKHLIQACLVACVDHGTDPPSAHVTRTVASCGKPIADSVAAGLLTIGPRHGNAASGASLWIREAVRSGHTSTMVVQQAIAEKRRLPGLGHPVYSVDPRTVKLIELAKSLLTSTPHCDFALDVANVFQKEKGRPLPLNIDGALGAIFADLGAPTDLADSIFIAGRTIGLIAHAREEASQSVSYRR